jgi:UDP-N-acetylmuramate dehydrogenase
MNWSVGYSGRVDRDVSLSELTRFRLGGRARWMVCPRDEDELGVLVRRLREDGTPVKILGGGANVLVRDEGFDGVVVRLSGGSFTAFHRDGDTVVAGGGVDLTQFTRECAKRGWSGVEGMAGIPGTVGGAVRMNAGGRFGEFGDVVREVRVVEPDGKATRLSHDELEFGYRRSRLNDAIVTSVTLALREDDPGRVWDRYKNCWQIKRDSQPLSDKSAGCIFKNPVNGVAGVLIEQAELKGESRGGARVSTHHANFIVTDDTATSGDVLRLIEYVRAEVSRRCGVDLELEIDVW